MGMSLEEYAAKQSEQDKIKAAEFAPSYSLKDWAGYREKLLCQMQLFEDMQRNTKDISVIRTLSADILYLAKKIDEIDNGYIRA